MLAAGATLAALGIALVNFGLGGTVDARVPLTLVVFGIAYGGIHLAVRRWAGDASPYLFPLAAILSAVGITEVYRIDKSLGANQLWWLLIASGVAVLVLYALRDAGVAVLRRYRYLFLIAAMVLLLLPLLPDGLPLHGAEVNGSRLWVRLNLPFTNGDLGFQPGEIAKLCLVIFLASYLAERHAAMRHMTRQIGSLHLPEPRQLVPVLIAWGASFVVLVYQRDLGASLLVFAVFVAMLYVGTGRHSYLVTGGVLAVSGGLIAYQLFDHVQRRVTAWLNPFNDYLDSGFQVSQSLFALGSGSLTGSGLGVGRPDLIPAAATDYIFAAVAEETGLAGALAIIAAFALLVTAALGIALRSRDLFRKLLAAGLAITLAVQTILILAGVVRLLPVTGITLPFMSYGGSSLVSNMIVLALLARVSHEERA